MRSSRCPGERRQGCEGPGKSTAELPRATAQAQAAPYLDC